MAHKEQKEFIFYVKRKFPWFFKEKFVLDIGSLDINGNNQEFFENCGYIGVDLAYERNVDIVCKGHDLGLPDCTFDVVISTETFEHDPFYPQTIKNMYRLLKSGGLFIFTCATAEREEHGTKRTTPEDAPFIAGDPHFENYYKNLSEEDIRAVLDIENLFKEYEFIVNEEHHDLYFWGLKKGWFIEHKGYSFLLKNSQLEERIREINVELSLQRARNEELLDELSGLREEKVQLEQSKQELEAEFSQLRARSEELVGELLKLRGEKAQLEQEKEILEGALSLQRAKNEELLNELVKLYLSISWGITKPLRWVKRKLKKCMGGNAS